MTYSMSEIGEEAVQQLERQGFSLPEKPQDPYSMEDLLSLPDLSDEGIIELFAVATSWADYAAAQHALAVISEREYERSAEVAESEVWASMPAKTPVSESKAALARDDRVAGARHDLDRAMAYRKLLSSLCERYERDAALISREITRRTHELSHKRSRREKW